MKYKFVGTQGQGEALIYETNHFNLHTFRREYLAYIGDMSVGILVENSFLSQKEVYKLLGFTEEEIDEYCWAKQNLSDIRYSLLHK